MEFDHYTSQRMSNEQVIELLELPPEKAQEALEAMRALQPAQGVLFNLQLLELCREVGQKLAEEMDITQRIAGLLRPSEPGILCS